MTKACYFFSKGSCAYGAECTYSHDLDVCAQAESRATFARQCKYFAQGNCQYGSDCNYVHDEKAPLADSSPISFKQAPCKYFARGFCQYGTQCNFLHADNIGADSDVPEQLSDIFVRRTRPRLACGFGFGCACCGPRTQSSQVGLDFDMQTAGPTPTKFEQSTAARRCLKTQTAIVDGNRDAPYVDTHVHLEMVLQKVRWYECAPSCLEIRWDFLTEDEKQCWITLGFTPTLQLSGRGGKPKGNPTWYKHWDAISEAERMAAEALGWDAAKWNSFTWILPENVSWCELDDATRRHLVVLGETNISWDRMCGSHPPAGFFYGGDMRIWKELTLAEQQAAAHLGFSPASWNMEEMSDVHAYIRDYCGNGFEGCIAQGCDAESIDDTVKLALAHPKIFAAFGCHPKVAFTYEENNLEERFLAAYEACGKKAVAWGEVGLDFSHNKWGDVKTYQDQQIRVFARQVAIALEKQLPLVLHIRTAADESLKFMRKHIPSDWKMHVHGYHGPSEFIEAVLNDFPNAYFGVAGTVSIPGPDSDGLRVARFVPIHRMLLETDGPFFLPRGTWINHVGQIPYIARLVAAARACDVGEILLQTRENCRHVYGI